MVKVLVGDLFSSPMQTWVNTVNCVGVMGKGIALVFKQQFPDMYRDYAERCKRNEVRLGRPYLFRRLYTPWILNFPTKDHWRSVSRLADLEEGLRYLYEHYKDWEITSLAVPPLGCGHGGLDWRIVGPTLYRHLSRFDIPVELYAPHGTPADELTDHFLTEVAAEDIQQFTSGKTVEPAWFALAALLDRIEREPYHHPIGRTSFQKLAYFTTEAGIPTGLTFRKASYGPFSKDLKHQITRLQNNGLIQEERFGRMIRIRPGPAYRDALKAFKPQLAEWSESLRKVVDLFLRTDSQQAEIAATVHFAAHHLIEGTEPPMESEVLEAVRTWKLRRKPPLDEAEVATAIRNLNMLGWIEARFSAELVEEEWDEEEVS